MIAQRLHPTLKALLVVERKVLPAGQVRDRLRHILSQLIRRQDREHLRQTQRRRKFARAVVGLHGAILVLRRIPIRIAAHTAMFWSRLGAAEPACLLLLLGFCRRKGETVDRRVGVRDGFERVGDFNVASVVERLGQGDDGAAVPGRLFAQKVDGETETI